MEMVAGYGVHYGKKTETTGTGYPTFPRKLLIEMEDMW
jgi:hypothetical protein